MSDVKTGYEELFKGANVTPGYRLNNTRINFDQLSHFVGMKGRAYDQQEIKLLVVGRAVNGWGALNHLNSAEKFAEEAVGQLENNKFDWIVCDQGVLRNNCLDNGKYYWLNDSPFWRVSRNIWLAISGKENFKDSEQDRWVDYIAWTNLYKVAPKDTGNPTTTMARKQLNACKNILKAEIEKFNPTHILFITGYEWWFECFKELFDVDFCDIKKNEYRGENKNFFFAEASATTSAGVKIVIACRPEFRDENLYVEDILNSFKSSNN